MGLLAYIEEIYIGRRGPAGRRRPPLEQEWRKVESRMLTGGLRTHVAIESCRDAFVRMSYRAGRSPQRGPITRIGKYASEYEFWGNIGCRKYTNY